jgi:uncharacterized OB-fold protein
MSTTVPVRPGLFVEGDPPRLLGSRCATCGGHHFPRHDTCAYCASSDVSEVSLSPTGRLWAWTAVTAAPPGYLGEVPYGFGVVELDDGIRVITRLTVADPAALASGQPVHLVIVPLHADESGAQVVTYAFAPSQS